MQKVLKALHLLGAIMFFGSILGHVTVGLIPAAQDDAQVAVVARQAIAVATSHLTVPGLVLVILTGMAMVAFGKLPILRLRWLSLHATIALLIALNAAFVLYPVGQELLEGTSLAAKGAMPLEQLHSMEQREAAFGAANLLLCLVTLFVAVMKPPFGKSRP